MAFVWVRKVVSGNLIERSTSDLYHETVSEDLQCAIRAAKEAGVMIRSAFRGELTIMQKGERDMYTTIDVDAEHAIIEMLGSSGYSVYGEETGITHGKGNKMWIIDPLDGTQNFVRGLPFFAVSIALIENDDLVLGVVYDPLLDECYSAERNAGAYRNRERITASKKEALMDAAVLIEHGKSAISRKRYAECTTVLMQQGCTVLRLGSTALMLCHVATGGFDAFVSVGDELYDHAAGLIIAKEAGAHISDWSGNAWRRDSETIAVAPDVLCKNIVNYTSTL